MFFPLDFFATLLITMGPIKVSGLRPTRPQFRATYSAQDCHKSSDCSGTIVDTTTTNSKTA